MSYQSLTEAGVIADDARAQTPIQVVTVLRQLKGGSQALLVRCNDRKLHVVKLNGNRQGPNVLANEALGSHLMRRVGFLVPPTRVVTLSKTVLHRPGLAPWSATTDSVSIESGHHFASEFLGKAKSHLYDWLPESHQARISKNADFLGVYIFDIWASHQDERQCVYRQRDGHRHFDAFFIDNGHLFGGPAWAEVTGYARSPAWVNLPIISQDDPRIKLWLSYFQAVLPDLLREAIALVPAHWYIGNLNYLETILIDRLRHLSALVEHELTSRNAWLSSQHNRDRRESINSAVLV